MKKISSYLANYISPSAGFSEGRLKDDPGDATGSGATVQTGNDWLYGMYATILKYLGVLSDTDESETASDFRDSIEVMAGVKNSNVSEYDNTTTYAQDNHVMYLGVQFVSMISSNLGNNPMDNPDKWLPCLDRDDVFVKFRNGETILGGIEALHDYRDSGYRQLFEWGKYNFGGDSGRDFQATGLHLDGTVVTGNTTLENLLDVGGANEYHLLDIIAPDVAGTRTLLDTRGRAPRIVDAGGGDTSNVGVVQEDQFQGHWHSMDINPIGGPNNSFAAAAGNAGVASPGPRSTLLDNKAADIETDGVNGTPRIGSETRMKNYTIGVASIIILNEI